MARRRLGDCFRDYRRLPVLGIWAVSVSISSAPRVTQPISGPSVSFANITTNTTTTVKSGAGTLYNIAINTLGNTAVVTIYDNTVGSGTKIGTLTLVSGLPTPVYNVNFATGLTLVTTGIAAPDITIAYS